MSVQEPIKKLLNIWSGLILVGFVMLMVGGIKTVAFLNSVPMYKTITAKQLILELVIPHMIMLFGMGILVAGIIFRVRRGIIHTRMNQKPV